MAISAKDVVLSNGLTLDDYVRLNAMDKPLLRHMQPEVRYIQARDSTAIPITTRYTDIEIESSVVNWRSVDQLSITTDGTILRGDNTSFMRYMVLMLMNFRVTGKEDAEIFLQLAFRTNASDPYSAWGNTRQHISIKKDGANASKTYNVPFVAPLLLENHPYAEYVFQAACTSSGDTTCTVQAGSSHGIIIGVAINEA